MAGLGMSKHSILVFASALLLAGCPDPEARFDEFTDRTEDQRQGGGGTGPSGGVADINGRFLMGIDTVIGPGKVLEFDTETIINFPCTDDCVLTLNVQPVVPTTPARSGCDDRGTPVGPVITVENVPVAADGSFIADFGNQNVPGCANPISGSDITANLILAGQIVNADLYCGTVSGTVSRPLSAPLRGSSFAAVRVEEGAELPAPVGECPAGTGEGGAGGEGGTGAGGTGEGGTGAGGTGEGGIGGGGTGEGGSGGDGVGGDDGEG